MNSRVIIKKLEANGWVLKRTKGSHHHYRHPDNPHLVTVPHPKKDIPKGTLRSLEKLSGLKF